MTLAYLQLPEVERISRPVHLGEEILIEHFAQEFEQINLHLVEGLILKQPEQFTFPFLVVQRREEVAEDGGHLAATTAATAIAIASAARAVQAHSAIGGRATWGRAEREFLQ